jgi:hypothetical protein
MQKIVYREISGIEAEITKTGTHLKQIAGYSKNTHRIYLKHVETGLRPVSTIYCHNKIYKKKEPIFLP